LPDVVFLWYLFLKYAVTYKPLYNLCLRKSPYAISKEFVTRWYALQLTKRVLRLLKDFAIKVNLYYFLFKIIFKVNRQMPK